MKTDYSKLAVSYDDRYSFDKMQPTFEYLANEIKRNNFKNILEAGCGTGYWLKKLSGQDVSVFGLDYSFPMLSKAKSKWKLFKLVNADACALPFKKSSFDFIFCVNSFHHFPEKTNFLEGAFKALKTKGEIVIVLADIFNPHYKWYVYDYFERAFNIDFVRVPQISMLENLMAETGFVEIKSEVTETINDDRKGKSVLEDYFLTRKGNSTLFALTEEEYFEGLKKIRREANNPETVFETNIIFKSVIGKKQ